MEQAKSLSSESGPNSSEGRLDPGQFAQWFVESHDRLWSLAMAITRDRTEASDVLQEAALVALKKLEQFQPGTNLGAWMGQIVRYTALNSLRNTRKRNTAATDPQEIDQQHSGPREETSDRAVSLTSVGALPEHQTDFDDQIVNALDAVSEVARSCVLLRCVQKLAYSEIAELLAIPEGTAMSHVHRAKKILRQHLQDPQRVVKRGREASHE